MSERVVQIMNDVPAELSGQIDRLGARTADYEVAKKFVKAYDDDKKLLASRLAEGVEAGTVRVARGETYLAELGAPAQARQLTNLPRLVEILTPPVFLQICKVNIGDIDKYLTEAQKDEVLTKVDGARSVKLSKRG